MNLRGAAERAFRSLLLWLSRRRSLGRLATAVPFTRPMVARFVAGERLEAALPALRRAKAAGFHTTVDLLGESVGSIDAAGAAADDYIRTLHALDREGLDLNVSLKLSQMGLGLDPSAARDNLGRVLVAAAELGAFVRIDMEDHMTTDATLDIWRQLRPAMAGQGDVGVVIQAALRRSDADVDRLVAEQARVRLCKGAYNEPPDVAFATRAEVDASYLRLVDRLLPDGRFPAVATHDDHMVDHAIEVARSRGIAPDRFEFQMLYGVRRDLQERLLRDGWGVRVYVPFGDRWWPYFMRRLAERPANVTFLVGSLLRERRGS
ncbi:MAG TPA: proline dehydrogenase family protein [Candidatus Limnocylindrales bacterium]|nr:proline dehydrogenase family protein [Candidatus Limnocylindrales bacterium]